MSSNTDHNLIKAGGDTDWAVFNNSNNADCTQQCCTIKATEQYFIYTNTYTDQYIERWSITHIHIYTY